MGAKYTIAGIALGSNLGDRERTLQGALRRLDCAPGVVVLKRSTWHETEPELGPEGGPEGQGPFLNGVALVETTLTPEALLNLLQAIEHKAGRTRTVPNGPRTLDLDLLWHGESRRDSSELTLPHPRMHQRTFVLAPLAEIAPDHPLATGMTVAAGLAALQAPS